MKQRRALKRAAARELKLVAFRAARDRVREHSGMVGNGIELLPFPVGTEPLEIAHGVVDASRFVRTNEQSVNGMAVFWALFAVTVVVGYLYLLNGAAMRGSHRSDESAGRLATAQAELGLATNTPGVVAGIVLPPGFAGVVVVNPTASAVVPSATVAPTATEVNQGAVYDVAYSYYDPELGGTNCHSANWDGSHCADTTASGFRWSDYVGHAVAVPPSWMSMMGYGTVLRVVDPGSIAGDYTVIDLCSGCEAGVWPDRRYRLDFLDSAQRLPWAFGVKFKLLHLVPVPTVTPWPGVK